MIEKNTGLNFPETSMKHLNSEKKNLCLTNRKIYCAPEKKHITDRLSSIQENEML